MRKSTLLAIHPASVCLSVTFVFLKAKDIIKLLFYQPGSPIILVFEPERRNTIAREPPSGGVK